MTQPLTQAVLVAYFTCRGCSLANELAALDSKAKLTVQLLRGLIDFFQLPENTLRDQLNAHLSSGTGSLGLAPSAHLPKVLTSLTAIDLVAAVAQQAARPPAWARTCSRMYFLLYFSLDTDNKKVVCLRPKAHKDFAIVSKSATHNNGEYFEALEMSRVDEKSYSADAHAMSTLCCATPSTCPSLCQKIKLELNTLGYTVFWYHGRWSLHPKLPQRYNAVEAPFMVLSW